MATDGKRLEIQRLTSGKDGIPATLMQLGGSVSPFAHSESLAIRVLYERRRMSQRNISDPGMLGTRIPDADDI